MKQNEETYNAMLSAIGDHLSMVDRDLNIIWVNETAKEMFGDDIVGKKCYEAFYNRKTPCDPFPCIGLKSFQDGKLHSKETEVIDKNGNRLHFHSTANVALKDEYGNPETVIETSRDITQMKTLEARLLQAHKMTAIGTLAEGIAHDFNNILGIIMGNAELALSSVENVPEWNPLNEWLAEIKTASVRAKDVVTRILACAGIEGKKYKPIHIRPVIEESVKRVRAMIPSTVKIDSALSISHDIVKADASQIHQIVMNLCTNAYQAMYGKGGRLSVCLENITVSGPSKEEDHFLTPGLYVKLTVKDTGHGIDSADIQRIFDPYYTTKIPGLGTGLGLSIVNGIVRNTGGDISVLSDPGKGTQVMVFLPVTKEEVIEEQKIDSIPSVSGRERILFIDDEKSITQVGKQMLELFGYQVEIFSSPLEAIRLFQKNPHRFDLVITDMMMPVMTGDRLVEEILKIRPDIPVILCSGHSRVIDKEAAAKLGIKAIISKPFYMKEIVQITRKVLDDKKAEFRPET